MNINENILKILKKDANKAFKRGEIPVSALIVDSNGKIVSHACNNRQRECNVLGHAEVLAIEKAEKKIKDWRLNGYSMYVTLEPCNMCSMIIKECRLDHVYYILSKKKDEQDVVISINKSLMTCNEDNKRYYNDLLTSFFDNKR